MAKKLLKYYIKRTRTKTWRVIDSNSPKRCMEKQSDLLMTCDYGSNPSCKLSQWETAGMLLGSIPNLSMLRSHSTLGKSKRSLPC